MSSYGFNGVDFDTAYELLDANFAGHPLAPSIFTAYLEGSRFSEIGDQSTVHHVEGTYSAVRSRYRTYESNKELFWNVMDETYNMDVDDYKGWIVALSDNYSNGLLEQTQQDRSGKNTLPEFYQGMFDALIRDYRYFGQNEEADALERHGLSDESVEEFVALQTVAFLNSKPKNDKGGYNLARRLCNRERPLLLKFICDKLMGASWYVKQSGGFDGMLMHYKFKSKYRLFVGKPELDFLSHLFTKYEGGTIGNKFLEGQVGRPLVGAIQRSLEGATDHDGVVESFLNLAFYSGWDGWLARFIADMVYHDSEGPGDNPEFRVIQNYSRHFCNTGSFENANALTSVGRAQLEDINHKVSQWEDCELLEQVALKAIGDSKTGSGRSGNPNTSKVPTTVQAPDQVMVEAVTLGGGDGGHTEETTIGSSEDHF